jgi:Tfp pilus assembly protein PilN
VIRINLLPAKFRKTKGVQRIYTYVIIGLSALGILLILLLLNLAALIHGANQRIARIDATAAKIADKIAYLHGLTAREEQSGRLREMIRRLQPEQALWISLLDQLAVLVREDLWLTKLAPFPAAAGADLGLVMDGEAYTKISVADFLTSLETSDRFSDVQLVALTDTKTAVASLVQFKLNLSYRTERPAGGSQP